MALDENLLLFERGTCSFPTSQFYIKPYKSSSKVIPNKLSIYANSVAYKSSNGISTKMTLSALITCLQILLYFIALDLVVMKICSSTLKNNA